jgi:hypothetical protein
VARPTPSARDVADSVERVRQSEARFRPLRVEVQGGTVLIGPGGAPGEHVMAFARALSVVPGVERVVIQSNPSPNR